MATPGRGNWAAPTGPAKGGAARRGCPASPSPASSRRSPSSGLGLQQSWAVRGSERSSGSSQAIARVSGPGRSFPAGVSPPAAGCARTHTHTPVLALDSSLQPWQSRNPRPFLPGARPPQAPPGGEAGGRTRAGAGRGEGPALGECLAAPAPRVSDWATRSPPSVPLPPSRSPPSLARRQPRLAPCPLPGGTFRAAAAASFTL